MPEQLVNCLLAAAGGIGSKSIHELLFGQRLRREPEETKSCRIGGICTSVRTYVRPSVPPLRPLRGWPRPLRGGPRPLRASPPSSGPASERPGSASEGPQGGRDGWAEGRIYVRTDVQIPPILQDFVSSGSLRSRCPKRRKKNKEKERSPYVMSIH